MKGFIIYNKTAWRNMCLVLVVLGKVLWLQNNMDLKNDLYGKKRTPKLKRQKKWADLCEAKAEELSKISMISG